MLNKFIPPKEKQIQEQCEKDSRVNQNSASQTPTCSEPPGHRVETQVLGQNILGEIRGLHGSRDPGAASAADLGSTLHCPTSEHMSLHVGTTGSSAEHRSSLRKSDSSSHECKTLASSLVRLKLRFHPN